MLFCNGEKSSLKLHGSWVVSTTNTKFMNDGKIVIDIIALNIHALSTKTNIGEYLAWGGG